MLCQTFKYSELIGSSVYLSESDGLLLLGTFVLPGVSAIDLAIDDFRDHLTSFLQVAQPLDLVHQIGEFRILVDLDPVLDDRGDHVRR